ncbi:MAG: hypothetical protein KGQ59_10380 [Bdellovibrionales bacterium]|nr:hypothetical protein [Bdellovibrionales bacterium]
MTLFRGTTWALILGFAGFVAAAEGPSLREAVQDASRIQKALEQTDPSRCNDTASTQRELERRRIGDTGTLVIPRPQSCRTLKVYFPGHAQELGLTSAVPSALRPKWAEILLTGQNYHLAPTITQAGCPVLILGESKMAISASQVEQLLQETGATQIELLSHSGGFIGLDQTLRAWKGNSILDKVTGLKLLDNFYNTSRVPQTLVNTFGSSRLQSICSGFYTSHNASRVAQSYRKICPNLKSGASHKADVKEYFR